MMNPWSSQLSAQIVDRMEREGVEVVESPFEREWQPGPLSRLLAALRACRANGAAASGAETVLTEQARS